VIEITLDGDKSLSHRYLLVSSLIDSQCKIWNLNSGKDVLTTQKVLSRLGMNFDITSNSILTDSSNAYKKDLSVPLNCENSGTTIRLLAGMVSAQDISLQLIGDSSLSQRPMDRIVSPLIKLGANISAKQGLPPISVFPSNLNNISHEIKLEVASAQVKSSLLLFSFIKGLELKLTGKISSRDHTELLLKQLGANIYISKDNIHLHPSPSLNSFEVRVPGDFSSAMFLIAFRLLVPGPTLVLKKILLNPTRSYALEILKAMGAKIEISDKRIELGEIVGDINIDYSQDLKNPKTISSQVVPLIIDEIPILSLICSRSKGEVRIEGVHELKYKESNRLDEISRIFPGCLIQNDNLKILGDNKNFNKISSHDHRILMTQVVAQSIKSIPKIENDELKNIEISYPDLKKHLFILANKSR